MNILVYTCLTIAIILSVYELVGVIKARIEKRTLSTRRVIMRFFMSALLLFLLLQYIDWSSYLISINIDNLADARLHNKPFLTCVVIICFIVFFVFKELINIHMARKRGLTKNISRFVSVFIIFLCMIPVLLSSVRMWDAYTLKLESHYIPATQLK